jgi:hypothetical protein
MQKTTFTLNYIENSFNSSGRGACWQTFAALPDSNGGWLPFVRLDKVPGAIVLSVARNNAGEIRSADRHAKGEVEIDLPEDTLIKEVATSATSPAEKGTNGYRVKNGELESIHFVGNKKNDDGSWSAVFKIDGKRVIV